MPFIILVILFIIVPVAEISLLIKVGVAIGGFNTILFVILTAVLGAYLVRQQGFATITKLQQETQAGRIPALQIAEGVALLFAGAVLLTPGFITDAIGFILLIPLTRRHTQGSQQTKNDSPNVIEGEYTDPSDDK